MVSCCGMLVQFGVVLSLFFALTVADSSSSLVWLEKEYFHVSVTNAPTGRVNATSLDSSCLSLYLVSGQVFETFVRSYSRETLRAGNLLDRDCTDTYAACTAKFRETTKARRYLVLLNRNWSAAARFSLELVVDDVYAYRTLNRTVYAGKYHDALHLDRYAATWEVLLRAEVPLSAALLTNEDYRHFAAAPGVLYGGNVTLLRERDLLAGLCDERSKVLPGCFFQVELSPLHEYMLVAYSATLAKVDYKAEFVFPEQLRATWVEYIYTAWNALKSFPWGLFL